MDMLMQRGDAVFERSQKDSGGVPRTLKELEHVYLPASLSISILLAYIR